MRRFAAAAMCVAFCGSPVRAQLAGSDPFVFVADREDNGARADLRTTVWYGLPMAIRPTGTAVAGFPLAMINQFLQRQLADRPATSPPQWCFANLLTERSYVSADRLVQTNIEKAFRDNPEHRFELRGHFTGGPELVARIGHYEECSGETYAFIIIFDPSGPDPSLIHIDVLPYVSALQYMRLVNGGITVSTCFECGDVTGLFYDAARQRWYWELLGD